jgi:hypothetical protein
MDYYASDGSLMNEHHPVNRGYVFPGLLETNCIGGCPTLLVRRSAIDAVGGFDEHVTVEEDYVFIMRVCKTYEVDLVEEALVRVDYGHGLPQTSIGNYNDRNYSLRRIQSTEAKIRIVGNDSRKYAKQVCHFYNYMAFLHGCLGDWGSSARCFCRALRWRPLSTETPRTLARLAKRSVKRVSGNDGT